jgi:hypothetical protein
LPRTFIDQSTETGFSSAAGRDDGHHGAPQLLHQLCPLLPHVAAVQEDLQQGPPLEGPHQQAYFWLPLQSKFFYGVSCYKLQKLIVS